MRRSDRQVTERDQILEILRRCDVCRLALNDPAEGVPYILPLNFGYSIDAADDGNLTLYFHGATEGRKYELIAADPRAAFEMDCDHRLASDREKGYCTMEYASIIGRGVIQFIDDPEEKARALTILTDNYHRQEHFSYNPAAIPRTKVMALKVEHLTAKRRIKK